MSLPNGLKIWLALGADLLGDPSSWTWTDITAYTLNDDGGGVTIDIGYPEGSDEASATRIAFLANNQDGRWTPTNPAGAWFGQIDVDTPVKVTFDPGSGDVTRGIAFLADLPLEWTTGGKFRFVRVEAFGRLSRMENTDTLDSSAHRWALWYPDLVAYWPFEDGSGAARASSAVAGQPDGLVFNVPFAADSDYGGSKPLPILDATSAIFLTVAPYARPYPEAWSVCLAWRIPARPAATSLLAIAVVCDTGAVRKWVLEMTNATPSVVRLRGYNSAGAEVLADTGISFDNLNTIESYEPFGDQLAIEIYTAQNGTGIDWGFTIWRAGTAGGGGSTGTLAASTLGPVTSLVTGGSGVENGHTVGHYAVYARGSAGSTAASAIAAAGVGDLTVDRFAGQAALNNVPVSFGASSGEPMGPVPTDTLINVLREADRLERGLMWEDPGGDLRIRSRQDLTNRTVALTLTYATHLRNLQPTSAVRDYINRATVTRTGGSSARVDATGPLSPTNRGVVRARELTVNAMTDAHLQYYAQWEVALGTVLDYRYTVDLQFHGAASSKLSTWLGMSLGDRVQITSPPAWLPPDTIDGYVRGYSEHINRFEYDLTLRLLPYRPYLAWTVEGTGNTGRANTSGSRLLAPVTTSGTSAIVGTYGNPTGKTGVAAKWSTASVPYDLALRSVERVTCTAVANNPPTFVAAGTAAHADYDAVTPGMPAGMAAGDLLLLLCSIRDSGFSYLAGVAGRLALFVGDQTGWTTLASFGGANKAFRLYGRTYTSGFTAPTLTPGTGSGAAGDTVSAQMAGFRYTQPLVHNAATPLQNGSAADIAYPGLGVVRNGTVVLIVSQKDDDWTSVASPAGFTEIGEPDSTLGSDQGLAWYYQIQTTATRIDAGSLVVTGGAAATSKATTLSLLGDCQTLTLTRNVNSITGGVAHPAGAEINLWRAGVVMRP